MNKKIRTEFCIICGKDFNNNVKPSIEHIIPGALGNKKLTTHNVCEECNSALGAYVDSYLTEHIFVKMIRAMKLEKDKDLQIFDSDLISDQKVKFRIRNNGPEIIPRVKIDKEEQTICIEAASREEGVKIARGILKKQFYKTNAEIDAIFTDPKRFLVGDTHYIQPVKFNQDVSMDFARFKLAAIKIGFEYAAEKLGAVYATDDVAVILRSFLYAGKQSKKDFTEKEYTIINNHCNCTDSLTDSFSKISSYVISSTGGTKKVRHILFLSSDAANKLICCFRVLDEDLLTFTVLLSNDARQYLGGKCFISILFEDGELVEMHDFDIDSV